MINIFKKVATTTPKSKNIEDVLFNKVETKISINQSRIQTINDEFQFYPIKLLKMIYNFALNKKIGRREAQISYIQYGFYTGIFPIFYDENSKMFRVQKSWKGLFTLFITFTAYTLSTIAATYILVQRSIEGEFDMLLLFKMCSQAFCLIIHGHTFLKRYEIVQLINGYNKYIIKFHGQSPEEIQKKEMVGKIIHFIILNMFLLTFVSGHLFFATCEIHFLSTFLSTCTATNTNTWSGRFEASHKSLLLSLFIYFPIHLFLSNCMNTAMFPYMCVAINIIFDGLETLRRLRFRIVDTKPIKVLNHVSYNWLLEYRCVEILGRQVNNCLGDYLLPLHMSQLIFLAIIAVYVTVRLDLGITMKFAIPLALIMVFLFLGLWKHGTVFRDMSKEAIRNQRMRYRSKYSKRVFNSCKILAINIGDYFKLTERVILGSYAAIVERSIAVLIL